MSASLCINYKCQICGSTCSMDSQMLNSGCSTQRRSTSSSSTRSSRTTLTTISSSSMRPLPSRALPGSISHRRASPSPTHPRQTLHLSHCCLIFQASPVALEVELGVASLETHHPIHQKEEVLLICFFSVSRWHIALRRIAVRHMHTRALLWRQPLMVQVLTRHTSRCSNSPQTAFEHLIYSCRCYLVG